MQMTPEQTKTIGNTIRTVAANQSKRFFKSEANTVERSALVFLSIEAEVRLALRDAGISLKMVLDDIDPTQDIWDQMQRDGYMMEGTIS